MESEVRVLYNSEFMRGNVFREWLKQQGESSTDIGSHAGIMDRSVMLVVDPTMVRQDQLAHGDDSYTTGVRGNPTRASFEYGKQGLEIQISNKCGCALLPTTLNLVL